MLTLNAMLALCKVRKAFIGKLDALLFPPLGIKPLSNAS